MSGGHKSHQPPPTEVFEQFIPYWTGEAGWRSELQLRNNTNGDLTVTPAIRAASGAESPLPPITIKAQEVRSLDIVDTAPQFAGLYSSAVLRYNSSFSRAIYAAVMVRSIGHPIAFHLDALAEAPEFDGATREGIWWIPNGTASDYLVLTNQGGAAMTVDLSVYDAGGKEFKQPLKLAARQTSRYSFRDLLRSAGFTSSFGGIRVVARSHEGSLDTVHFVYDEQAGFSALLKMFDHDPHATIAQRDFAKTGQWTTRAPMLALSQPDPALAFPVGVRLQPQLFIRNTLNKSANASLRLSWRSATATGTAKGPSIRLAPFETRCIDVGALQDGKVLPREANWTSVEIVTDTKPDEVIANAASYDSSLRYGAQTPFSDQLSFKWKGGMWEYDPQHDSIIAAGNGSKKTTDAAFTIFYNKGADKYELQQTLQPDEQMWIDVGKLIHDRVPDKNGKMLPTDLTMGSYEFRDLTDIGIGSLYEGKVIYDRTYGSATYGCANCCGYHSPFLDYDPLGMFTGGLGQNGVEADDTCGDGEVDISGYFVNNWTTANHAVATVSGAGLHTGVGVGSTTSTTNGVYASYAPRSCPVIRQYASGGDNVAHLSCTSPVTRGASSTCTVQAPSGTTVSGWKFADSSGNTVTRTTNTTSLTWSGVMVTGGTVSVTASGVASPLTANISVSNRSNFAFTAVSPTQASGNSITCYNGDTAVLVSPPNSTSIKGASCADLAFSFNDSSVSDNGPNNGYQYVTAVSGTSNGQPTQFPYIIVSDLLSATTFYNAQCGTYSSSNSSGFIAGVQLKQNVFDHEQGSILSHWTEYRDAQNISSNNVGTVLEAMTAPLGTSQSTYEGQLTKAGQTAISNISAAAGIEPCNEDPTRDSSQSCAECGAINYSPYQTCSGQPVPYCH
ncbi:MAG TPA: hypothetical protein VNY51_02585 [Candidatus Dormibacteraeota bacterium]|nr:hypothetical protein [Candidatus Dormibacteraeota bacterium]